MIVLLISRMVLLIHTLLPEIKKNIQENRYKVVSVVIKILASPFSDSISVHGNNYHSVYRHFAIGIHSLISPFHNNRFIEILNTYIHIPYFEIIHD